MSRSSNEEEDEIERQVNEIAMMVRCNKSPDDLLIQEGRALGALENDEKFDLQQLAIRMKQKKDAIDDNYDSSDVLVIQNENYFITDFFKKAVSNLFYTHAVKSINGDNMKVLDSKATATWLETCLNEKVVSHDKQVLSLISKYGDYGTGYLTESNFYQLYIDALKVSLIESFSGINKTAQNLWRDFYNHGIFSPSHEMHRALEKDMEEQINAIKDRNKMGSSSMSSSSSSNLFMDNKYYHDLEFVDECEILDWGLSSDEDKKELKSSHELVEMLSDNRTPKRIRDGSFG